MSTWLADTSVAVAAVVSSHRHHEEANRSLGRRKVRLPFHASIEAYSVLTRLPGDARLLPLDAALLLRARFGRPVVLSDDDASTLVDDLANLGIAGGAVYDALIAATARTVSATLLTRDRRAAATYHQLSVAYEFVA